MKIITVGSIPPPYGGVSNHLVRLMEYILPAYPDSLVLELSPTVKNKKEPYVRQIQTLKEMISFIFKEKKSIVHFHNFFGDIKYIFGLFLLSFKHVVLLSFHNERFLEELEKKGKLGLALSIFFFKPG